MTVTSVFVPQLLNLSDDENALIARLDIHRSTLQPSLQLRDAYYDGNQLIRDLGIAIPPQVRGLSTVVGWPQIAVDTIAERLTVQGFRYAGKPHGDDTLNGIWQDNDLDEESDLAHLDALVYRGAFACCGMNDDGSPLVTVESLRHMTVLWDPRWRMIVAALRVYGGDEFGQHLQATLYLPNQTIALSYEPNGWIVDDQEIGGRFVPGRDIHNFGEVPVARLANRQRVSERDGRSEITSQIMSLTDSACRTLLGLEVAREFFAAPQRWIMGASESSFVGPDGVKKTPWQTYIGRMLALEADDQGNLPTVGQFAAGDPAAYGKVMDVYRQEMSALTRLPPHMLGETTQNPASAAAITAAEHGLIKRIQQRQKAFSGGWETAMRLALRFANGGVLPKDAARIETIWAPAATPTPAETTDAVTKQVGAGMISPLSDVGLERLGYSVEERALIAAENKTDMSEELVAAVSKSMAAKSLRTFKVVESDAGVQTTPPPVVP